MAQPVEVEVEQGHEGGQSDAHHSVGKEAVFQDSSDVFLASVAEKASHDGSQSVRESR